MPVAICVLPATGNFPANTGLIMQEALFLNHYNSINLKFVSMTKLLTDEQ
jgi:hypothetical protein